MWNAVLDAGKKHNLMVIAPAHHRRIQAGILSWGQDMDQQHNPFQCNLGYQVSLSGKGEWNKKTDYVGKAALEKMGTEIKAGKKPYKLQLVGLELGGKPILVYVINWVKKNGIKEIVLCVSYLHKTIEDYFGDGKKFGVKIEYAISSKPLATAGQLKTAEKFIDDTFVCVYGDSLFDFNLRKMIDVHKKKKSFATMSLCEHKTSIQYGVIDTNNNGKVLAWNEKPEIKSKINMGCYVMEPSMLNFIPKGKKYGMNYAIKKAMSKRKTVSSILVKKGFIDVGDKKTYEKLNMEYRKRDKI